jgi:hypothetical protein
VYARQPPATAARAALALALAAALAVACADDYDASDAGPTRPSLPTAVTTADAAARATLLGEELIVVRTLPAADISQDDLSPAGTALTTDGGVVPLARTDFGGVQPWEYVSAGADGWRVWRPAVISAVANDAGPGSTVDLVEEVDWPDACLGAGAPDEICAQVVTPGYIVTIGRGSTRGNDGTTVRYHAARAGAFRIVPATTAP